MGLETQFWNYPSSHHPGSMKDACVSPIGSLPFKYRHFPSCSMIMGERVGHWNGISCSNQRRTNGWMVSLKCLSICLRIPTSGWCPPTWSQRIIRRFFPFWGGEVLTYYPTLCMIGYIGIFFEGSILGIKKVLFYGSITTRHIWKFPSEPTKRIWVDAVGLAGPNDPICCVVVLPYLILLLKKHVCFLPHMSLRFKTKSWTQKSQELRWVEERNHCSGRRD